MFCTQSSYTYTGVFFSAVEHLIAWGLGRMLKRSSEENRYANPIYKGNTVLVYDADVFRESRASHSGVQLRQANHVPEGVAPEDMILVEAPSPPRRPADGRHCPRRPLHCWSRKRCKKKRGHHDCHSLQVGGGVVQTATTLYKQMIQNMYDMHKDRRCRRQ